MFGSIAIFGSKGMVRVPSIIGSSTSAANSSIQGAGLKPINSGTINTNDSNLNGKVANQDPAANTLVNYETEVSYIFYNYVAPPPPPPPTCTPNWQNSGSCNGCTIPQSDGCGNTRTVDCSYLINLGPVSESLIGEDSSFCYYRTEYKWQNSCTGAISYTFEYWQIAKSNPNQSCFI